MPHYASRQNTDQNTGAQAMLPPTLSTSAFKAGIAVSANTLAARAQDGKLYPVAEPGKPGSSLLPMAQAADIINGLQSPPTLFASGMQGRIACVLLATNNVMLIWADAAPPYNVKCCVFDPHGVPLFGGNKLIGPSSATGGGGLPLVCAALLANGNVVIAYNLGGRPMFAIYDPSANQLKAPTAVDSASTIYALSVAALSGGNFVVCYNIAAINEVPTYAVYNASGVLVLAATPLRAAPASNATTVASCVCALAGGGFVCAYAINSSAANTNYFKRFDAAGALQGTESVVRAGVATNSGVVLRALASGGFALLETADVRLNVYNAAGALQGSAQVREQGFVQNNLAMATHPALDGGLIAWQSSSAGVIKALSYNAAGGVNPITVGNTASTSSQVLALMDGSGFAVVAWADSSNKLAAASYQPGLMLQGSTVYPGISADLLAAPLAGAATYLSSPLNPGAKTFLLTMPAVNGNALFGIINAYVAARTTVGMFTANAAAGNHVALQYSGVGTLSTAFDQIVIADYRSNGQANSQPGIKLSVVGNSVLMWGVQ